MLSTLAVMSVTRAAAAAAPAIGTVAARYMATHSLAEKYKAAKDSEPDFLGCFKVLCSAFGLRNVQTRFGMLPLTFSRLLSRTGLLRYRRQQAPRYQPWPLGNDAHDKLRSFCQVPLRGKFSASQLCPSYTV